MGVAEESHRQPAEPKRPRSRRPRRAQPPEGHAEGLGLILLAIDVDTSSPNGEFMLNVMGSAAQWESGIVSQRTKDALAVKRAQGVRLGRPSTLTPELVERIVREREGGASLSSIADALTDERVPTAHGGKWWPATVRKVLHGQDAKALGRAAV